MQPFRFGATKALNLGEMQRFEECAALCKRVGADEFPTRLDFYLHRQQAHVERTIKARYPKTFAEVTPYMETLRLARFMVDETAKVFLHGHGYEFPGAKPGSNEATRIADVQEELSLGMKLKLVDRYTTLDRTCFLRPDREEGGAMTAHVFLPENVDVVPDPCFPFDLDRAHGVRLRVGDGFEFWCARPDAEFYGRIAADGSLDAIPGNDKNALPYRDAAGKGLVPLVVFTLHAEELGLFTDEGQGLWRANLSADVCATDLGYISAVQGFGQLVISYPEGTGEGQQEVVIGPTRAIELKHGATASMLSASPQIAALLDALDKKIKRAASLAGIPPGSVSLEGRAVPSGVALQIEMRPLMEARTDAIDFYRPSMRRLWKLLGIIHDARAASGDPKLAGVEAHWHPGDVQVPESEDALVDRVIILMSKGLMSKVEAIAKLRRIDTEAAQKVLDQIAAEEKPVEPPKMPPGMLADEARKRLEATKDDPEEDEEEPEEVDPGEG